MAEMISIIVPVYNTKPYLKRCVDRVLCQTYPEFELILVDDGSTDGSGALCDDLACNDSRIRVIHQENRGVCAARNAGLKKMTGDFLLFIDSDDSIEAATLQKCIEAMQRSGADVAIFGWRTYRGNQLVDSGIYGSGMLTDSEQMIKDILTDRHIYGGGYPNKMWRISSFCDSAGCLPMYNTNLSYVEDMEWVIRMLKKAKKAILLDNYLYNYLLRDNSASQSKEKKEQRLITYHDTMAQIVEDLVEYPELQIWFKGIRYTELIDSIIDAKLKNQVNVYRLLYLQLEGRVADLLHGNVIKQKVKIRLLAVRRSRTWRL